MATKKKKKKVVPKGYDSNSEYRIHQKELKGWDYHSLKIPYVTTHSYEPDFLRDSDGFLTLVEYKGYFRSSAEASKYIAVRSCLPNNAELVFIFSDSTKAMPFAKKRKDGTKHTMGEWADKNDFKYWCMKTGVRQWM